MDKFRDHPGDLVRCERARHGGFHRHAIGAGDRVRTADGRGGHRFGGGILVRRHRCPADVHQLHHDAAAFGMDGIGNLAPARDLFGRVDARRAPVALAGGGRLGAFGDDQAGSGALAVIFHHQVGRHVARPGAVTRHRCHDDAVGKLDVTQLARREKVVAHHGPVLMTLARMPRPGSENRSERGMAVWNGSRPQPDISARVLRQPVRGRATGPVRRRSAPASRQ